jgi:hypothetical protein
MQTIILLNRICCHHTVFQAYPSRHPESLLFLTLKTHKVKIIGNYMQKSKDIVALQTQNIVNRILLSQATFDTQCKLL